MSMATSTSWATAPRMALRRAVRFPPHTWAVGSTFEYEFDFTVVTHQLYGSAKPSESKKRRTPSTSRPAEAEPVPEPKRLALPKTKGIKLTPEQRKEWDRANRAALRQRRKELGICPDCKNLALPGKTRCPDRAEKHSKPQR